MFLGCRISKIVVDPSDFPPLTCSSLQQEIPEQEAVRTAGIGTCGFGETGGAAWAFAEEEC